MTAVANNTIVKNEREHSLWARLGAELVGSALICFAIYTMCSYGTAFYSANSAYIALGIGVVYAAMTAIFGKISGAQFNPAVTVAAMLTSKTRVLDGVLYIIAQLVGAIAAGGLFWVLLPTSESITREQWLTLTVNGYDQGSSLYTTLSQMNLTYGIGLTIVVELIASIIVVAAAMQSLKRNGAATRQHTLIMGLAYAAATAMAFPITGAAVNPIRATGIAVFASSSNMTVNPLTQVWIFWVSSILAAAIVALVLIVAQLVSNHFVGQSGNDVAVAAMIEEQVSDDVDADEITTVSVQDSVAEQDNTEVQR